MFSCQRENFLLTRGADICIVMCMRYMDMTPEQLREAYIAERKALSGWSSLAQPRRQDGGRSARGTGRALRNVEFIENVARKRGIKLL